MKRNALFLSIVLIIPVILGACSSQGYISKAYSDEGEIRASNGENAQIYRAFQLDVPAVVDDIEENTSTEPIKVTKKDDEHMYMVYEDSLIHVMQDEKNPSDSLIEVSSPEFVRDNYSSSFLATYLILDTVEDAFEYKMKKQKNGYSGNIYKSKSFSKMKSTSNVKMGSTGSPGSRGGGPSSGK